MGRGAANQPLFTGMQYVVSTEALEAFVRGAKPDEQFTYCEAPQLIPSETSRRVREMAQEGLVRPHQTRRAGGGFTFFVVRTRLRPAAASTPAQVVLADRFTAAIFEELKQAAEKGRRCPSDAELMRRVGLFSTPQAQWRIRKLVEAGLIKSELVYEKGVPTRVVTIAASKKRTALPQGWAAAEQERGARA